MICVGSKIPIYYSPFEYGKGTFSEPFVNRNARFTMDLVNLGLGASVAELCATWDYGDCTSLFSTLHRRSILQNDVPSDAAWARAVNHHVVALS